MVSGVCREKEWPNIIVGLSPGLDEGRETRVSRKREDLVGGWISGFASLGHSGGGQTGPLTQVEGQPKQPFLGVSPLCITILIYGLCFHARSTRTAENRWSESDPLIEVTWSNRVQLISIVFRLIMARQHHDSLIHKMHIIIYYISAYNNFCSS